MLKWKYFIEEKNIDRREEFLFFRVLRVVVLFLICLFICHQIVRSSTSRSCQDSFDKELSCFH